MGRTCSAHFLSMFCTCSFHGNSMNNLLSYCGLVEAKIRASNIDLHVHRHGLRTPREEIAFTARPKIQSQSQIFRYGGSIFCLPHRPNFSDIFDLCFHWVSVVRGFNDCTVFKIYILFFVQKLDCKTMAVECIK